MSSERERNAQIIEEFRANAGKVGGHFEGRTLLLLTTTGAKTGRTHTTPAIYLDDAGRYIVFASNGGAPNNPGWYHNVRANRDVLVEVGTESFPATAAVLDGSERDELFRRQADRDPSFDEYQAGMAREMPVVALERTS
jgi:deazaflavin-dependent oxidoreductase (nitroreductase family)